VLNGPGTVDSDYRGEVKVILANLGKEPFAVERGMRIAQMVIMRVEKPKLEVVDKVPDTVRGEGGFGSSGR
jgi:dUTP pyrophosphatase